MANRRDVSPKGEGKGWKVTKPDRATPASQYRTQAAADKAGGAGPPPDGRGEPDRWLPEQKLPMVVFPAHALLILEERLKEQEADGVRMPQVMERGELALWILIAGQLTRNRIARQG